MRSPYASHVSTATELLVHTTLHRGCSSTCACTAPLGSMRALSCSMQTQMRMQVQGSGVALTVCNPPFFFLTRCKMLTHREGLMEASVFLGGGWLDGSGDEASQLGPGDSGHLPVPHDAGVSPAHAAAMQLHSPGMQWPYHSTPWTPSLSSST